MKGLLVFVIVHVLKNRIIFSVAARMIGVIEIFRYLYEKTSGIDGDERRALNLGDMVRWMYADGQIGFSVYDQRSLSGPFSYYDNIQGTLWHYAIIAFRTISNDVVINNMKMICDGFQKVIDRFSPKSHDLKRDGSLWVFWNILRWASSAFCEKSISYEDVLAVVSDFEEKINKKQAGFFWYANGNITGINVKYGPGGRISLANMDMVVRPGRGYYDFLHSIGWIFYNSSGKENECRLAKKWIAEHLVEYDAEEVRLVFALECLIFLGKYFLVGRTAVYGDENRDAKIKYLSGFIRREY